MDNLKYGVAACGLIGLVACFLPLGPGVTFWHLRGGMLADAYAVMAAYVVGMGVPAIAIAKPPLLRWQALAAIVAYAFVLFTLRESAKTFVVDGGIGAKLMILAPALGLGLAIVCLARPRLVTS